MRKVEQLIEEIRIERDELRSALNKIPKCVICLDKRPQKLYMPCLHFVCCDECGNELEQCPICRQKLCGKITNIIEEIQKRLVLHQQREKWIFI
ncbi:hypothetical protein X798_05215 [Onchocerca flexuosa]|uniref:RING-type domain-containing protein n=1 Tax=Onchocerca flexuosa TaxID=387005 RepID=A0A238BS90_9BILA|nr:hypothetical protein X798_05215 [Onchocerca flexuosa]